MSDDLPVANAIDLSAGYLKFTTGRVLLNGKTIGEAGDATKRANHDCSELFTLLWGERKD